MSAFEAPAARPLVTIGLCTYNRLKATLPQALASALAQSSHDVEVLVCDNASEDGTDVFMATQTDPRLRYHRHPKNIGANANFNSALAMARGRYFLMLSDDDLVDPDLVERVAVALDGDEPGVLLTGSRVIDASGHVTALTQAPPSGLRPAELFDAWFARQISFYLCTTLFHTDRLRAAGGFSTPENLLQDVVAIAVVASRHGYGSVPGIGGSFRRHPGNRGTAIHTLRWLTDSEYLLEVLRSTFPNDAARLGEAGAPYLARKCYRYVAANPSWRERRTLYRTIHDRLGGSYVPWRFRVDRWRRAAKAWLRDRIRRGARAQGTVDGL